MADHPENKKEKSTGHRTGHTTGHKGPSPAKAAEILRHGSVRGQPLSPKQERLMQRIRRGGRRA